MTKYHVNRETGRPNICRATVRGCPYGGEEVHFESKEEARKAYENEQRSNVVVKFERRFRSFADNCDDYLSRNEKAPLKVSRPTAKTLEKVVTGENVSTEEVDRAVLDLEVHTIPVGEHVDQARTARSARKMLEAFRKKGPSTIPTVDEFDPESMTVLPFDRDEVSAAELQSHCDKVAREHQRVRETFEEVSHVDDSDAGLHMRMSILSRKVEGKALALAIELDYLREVRPEFTNVEFDVEVDSATGSVRVPAARRL